MQDAAYSRRDFVAAIGSLGALWLLSSPRERASAGRHAHEQAALPPTQQRLLLLSREQAMELDAVASRIIPTDDTPGAHEAGVVYFIDNALTTFAQGQRGPIVDGLAKLATETATRFPGSARFSALTHAQQDEVLKGMENTEFFGNMRFATIAGMLSLPSYGGNRDWIGWKLVGQDLVQDFKPPFGWYDDPAHRRALLGDSGE